MSLSAAQTSAVSPRCNDPRMGWIEIIDGLGEFLPRRWKSWLSGGIVIAFLAFPSQAQRAVLWYGQERARQITEKVMPLLVPTKSPTAPSPSPSPRPS